MKAFLFILNFISFIGVLLWFIFEPGWDSGSSCGVTFATLISQFFWNDSVRKITNKNKTISHHNTQNEIGSMNQTAGKIQLYINRAGI